MRKISDERKYKAIELLASGDHNYMEVAELANISVDTLREWRKDAEFQDEVRARCRNLLNESEAFLYRAALREIEKNGSYQHIKLLLERMGRLEDIADGVGREYDVMFTWKGEEPSVYDR